MKFVIIGCKSSIAATNVNAGADYAEITTTAKVDVAKVLHCDDYTLNLGSFLVKEGNPQISPQATDTQSPFYDSPYY